MKINVFIIAGIIMLTLFLVKYSEAAEVKIATGQDAVEAESLKEIGIFLKNNSFPDSAYNVEIDKNVTVEDGSRVRLKIKVLPKQDFFVSFRNVIQHVLGYEWMNEPWIGIKVGGPRYSTKSEKSDYIIDIEKESPAIRAGLKIGDKILEYNGKVADGPKALEELVANSKIGDIITLYIETPKGYHNFSITVSEKKVLKRKNAKYNKNDKTLKIAGNEYKMSHITFESIMKLFNKEYFSSGFPLVVRYEFKNSSGQIMHSSEKEFKAFYRGSDYIDFDSLYAAGINYREVIDLNNGVDDIVNITVSPKQVKEIVASVVNRQKEREIEQAQQRELEEKKKKEAVLAAEQRKREEENRKQQKIIAQKQKEKRERLLPQCNNKILSHEEFMLGKNPYADKGKCVEFTAATFQMTSTNAGLFNIGNNELAFIEFKETFRGSGVQGIAKIKGLYNYTTRSGISNQVPHLEMLEIEKIIGR